ncbi:MAG: TonB-dependent receptor [Pseudomonadota bacterium]
MVVSTVVAACFALPAAAEGEMEEMVVIGQRAMLQNAIARQRDSDLIQSVVTRDAIGNFPDQNVAEAVRRLTGVNVLNDQGEGRFIAVRGLDPSLNAASVNGTRIPSPESDSRSVALDVIPAELVESIEVVKTLTPDMDADTIGAAIRIQTTSAFDRTDPFVTFKAEQSYNDLNGETSPKASVDFMYPISDSLGVAGGFSFNRRETSTDNIEVDGWDVTDTGITFADAVEYRDYDVLRERVGGALSVDFRASRSTSLFARALYSLFDDTEERRRLVFEMDEEPSSGTANSASFLSDDGEISVRRGLKDRYESQTIQSYEIGGTTETGNWSLDYKVSYSRAEENENRTQDPTRFRNDFDGPGELGVTFDYSQLESTTYNISVGQASFLDPATYEIDKVEQVDGRAEDEEVAFQFDAGRTFSTTDGLLLVKFGAKTRSRTKSYDLYLEVLEDYSGNYSLADVTGSQSYGLAAIDPLPDLGAVRRFNAANLAGFELNSLDTNFESNVADFAVDEDVFAGYLMGRYESGPLTVVGGVRMERTKSDARGNLVELVEEDGVRNGVVLTEDTLFVTPNSFQTSYTDWLPSISLRLEAEDNLLIRAGLFRSVVRPNIAQLAPRFVVEEADDGERVGEFGNPALQPYLAWNYDASAEWYFTSDAVVQVGVFYKTIDNFIVNAEFDAGDPPFSGTFNGVSFDEALIPLNGNEASVTGIEFNYQQALSRLPAPFDGLLIGFNYTFTDSEGDINGRTIPLPAASENNYNAMLGYEKGPVSLRVTAAYRDEYLDELGGSAEEDRYVKDHLQVDVTASYQVTEQFKLYAQLVNLNDEPYVAFQRGPGRDRLLQYETYSWTGKIGLQASF